MKLTFTKTLVNNVYSVTVATSEFEVTDTTLFTEFGEPSIDIGGTFTDDTNAVIGIIPSTTRKVSSQFPLTMRFNQAAFMNKPKIAATQWIALIESRMTTAMDAIRTQLDDFTGVEDITI